MKITILTLTLILLCQFTYAQITTVTNPTTGKTWMDKNLGANQVATSITDTASYGSLFQWGRLADGHELRTSNTTSIISTSNIPGHSDFIIGSDDWIAPSNDSLWQGVNGINNPCPNGFRIPTEQEWEAERLSWISNDAAGAFASVLKLPLPGARSRMSGVIGNIGTFSGYRTSDLSGTDTRLMGISLTAAIMGNRNRADGNCVRCIQESNTMAVQEVKQHFELKVFPNPTANQINVKADSKLIGTAYTLYSNLGTAVFSGIINNENTLIEMENLPGGIYMLSVGNSSKQIFKVIKQ